MLDLAAYLLKLPLGEYGPDGRYGDRQQGGDDKQETSQCSADSPVRMAVRFPEESVCHGIRPNAGM